MSNNETIFSLKMTTIGQEKMTRLLYAGIKPKLKLGLGTSQEPITGEEKEIEKNFFIFHDSLITLSEEKEMKLQVQASLLGSNLAFDIYQIGLFISNSEAGKESLSLLAFYQGKQILAKKLANIDLFLDIIVHLSGYNVEAFTIDASEYKPLFNMLPATTERYGSVRLATSQMIQENANLKGLALTTELLADRNNISKREPGFILTTNTLDSFVTYKKLLKTQVFAEGSINLPIIADSVLFLAFNAEGSFRNSFFAIKSPSDESDEMALFLLRYRAKDTKLAKLVNLQEIANLQDVRLPTRFRGGECCSSDNSIEGGKNYYFFSEQGLSKLSLMFSDEEKKDPELAIQASSSFKEGRLFFYNDTLGILHKNKTDQLLLLDASLNELGKAVDLRYPRENMLIQVVQDKIYCFSGTVTKLPFVQIYQAYFNNKLPFFSSYVPVSNSPIEDMSNYIACTVGFRVYFFSLISDKNGLKELGEIYYQYDTLTNHWLRNAFTVESSKLFPNPFSQVAFINYGSQLSAFFIHHLASKKEINYTNIVFSEQ